jgi:phospholipid/cholesterol/gamma-HCH transport system substrate-binding protein
MKHAIKKHMRDFLAIIGLILIAMAVAAYVLGHQRLYLPAWVPFVGTDFYTVNAEFSTAQAVVPGQGQTVNIAGVPIGEIGGVKLENGVAIVQMKIKKSIRKAPVYKNATLLLRPKTGLKDMYIEMDPGTKSAGAVADNGTLPVSNTLPDVNLDEVLSNLDSDTRAYLEILINAGGQAFSSPSTAAELRQTFKRFDPTAQDTAEFTSLLSKRRANLQRVVHNFQLLTTALAGKDHQLSQLVDSSNANFQAIAQEDQKLEETLQLLPGTLTSASTALGKTDKLAQVLGPTFQALRPGARALGPSLREVRPFLNETTPVIRDQLRPFSVKAQPTVHNLRLAAHKLLPTAPRLTRTASFLNVLFNELAYNPPGSANGFLYYAAWLNHAGASIFSTQDAHGAVRRGLFITDCTSLAVLQAIQQVNPQLKTLVSLLNAPTQQQVCSGSATPAGATP